MTSYMALRVIFSSDGDHVTVATSTKVYLQECHELVWLLLTKRSFNEIYREKLKLIGH